MNTTPNTVAEPSATVVRNGSHVCVPVSVCDARSKCIRQRDEKTVPQSPTLISPLPYHLRIDTAIRMCSIFHAVRSHLWCVRARSPSKSVSVNAIAKITDVFKFNANAVTARCDASDAQPTHTHSIKAGNNKIRRKNCVRRTTASTAEYPIFLLASSPLCSVRPSSTTNFSLRRRFSGIASVACHTSHIRCRAPSALLIKPYVNANSRTVDCRKAKCVRVPADKYKNGQRDSREFIQN